MSIIKVGNSDYNTHKGRFTLKIIVKNFPELPQGNLYPVLHGLYRYAVPLRYDLVFEAFFTAPGKGVGNSFGKGIPYLFHKGGKLQGVDVLFHGVVFQEFQSFVDIRPRDEKLSPAKFVEGFVARYSENKTADVFPRIKEMPVLQRERRVSWEMSRAFSVSWR